MFQCRGCGSAFVGRSTRVYCSLKCQREFERKRNVEAWLASGEAHMGTRQGHYVRRHIYDEQNGQCALCGLGAIWNGHDLAFILDHVDGDPDNNRRDNLRLVCPNCDSQLPTYKSRNRGRGRHLRRERYARGQSY